MGLRIWLDDKLVDGADAKVSVFDHGLLYGDGVFEGIRVYGERIFELEAHIDRLFDCARAIRLRIPMSKAQLTTATQETVAANDSVNYIRLVVTRGVGTLGLNPFTCEKGMVIIIADGIQLYPKALYQHGLKVISSSVIRNNPAALPPQVKSLNYLNNILAKIEALDRNDPELREAIMYNQAGYVAEATGDNVFIIKDGTIVTPPVSAGSLAGITRGVVIALADQADKTVLERNLTRFDLYTADECFLTGTAAEVIGVVEIDGRTIGTGAPGLVTEMLQEKFFDYAHNGSR